MPSYFRMLNRVNRKATPEELFDIKNRKEVLSGQVHDKNDPLSSSYFNPTFVTANKSNHGLNVKETEEDEKDRIMFVKELEKSARNVRLGDELARQRVVEKEKALNAKLRGL